MEMEITFNRDTSCATSHTKLVPGHAGVGSSIWFAYVPYAKITIIQNGNPAVKIYKRCVEKKLFFKYITDTNI